MKFKVHFTEAYVNDLLVRSPNQQTFLQAVTFLESGITVNAMACIKAVTNFTYLGLDTETGTQVLQPTSKALTCFQHIKTAIPSADHHKRI